MPVWCVYSVVRVHTHVAEFKLDVMFLHKNTLVFHSLSAAFPFLFLSHLLSPPPFYRSLHPSLAQLASAAAKPSSGTQSVDDFGLNVKSMDHTPLTRKSLEDVSDNVVLKSIKVDGVEIYRAAEV